MDATERLYYLGFSAFPGIGPLRFKLLRDYFGSAKAAWNASTDKLIEIGLGPVLAHKFATFKREFSLAGYARRVQELGVMVLTLQDEKYPRLLREIPDAPFLLYIKGKKPALSRHPELVSGSSEVAKVMLNPSADGHDKRQPWDINRSVAVVGTRRITSYGREITKQLVHELVASDITIVSGLAFGVDAVAHETAIESGGHTIAVLGCGVDCCNPGANQYIYDQIIRGSGVIVSEFPLSQRASKGLFPARNRIISGLSLGTVVTEGAEDSGALITARFAAEQGREVFAVPGPITSAYSQAPFRLLRDGAKLVTSASDILEELHLTHHLMTKPAMRKRAETDEEEQVLSLLEKEPLAIDAIIRHLSWETAQVAGILSMLEIKGNIKNEGGVYSIKL